MIEQKDPAKLEPMPELSDDTALDYVELPSRLRHALHDMGLKTVGEIREASDANLLSCQNLGKKSVTFLRKSLGRPWSDGVSSGNVDA